MIMYISLYIYIYIIVYNHNYICMYVHPEQIITETHVYNTIKINQQRKN